jgi:ABC-type phosphate transport system auxiliary subunit
MSLSGTDLLEIRSIFKEELREELQPIKGELEALSNDIKEIYEMISDLQKNAAGDKSFEKLSLEKKILQLHKQLTNAAKQAGINLPSH